jgi:aryl-alcohol dehydrogenase-like predicted oxidoreductase
METATSAYDRSQMPTRTLGRTGLQVSAIALGTVELGLDYGIQAPGHSGRPAVEEAIRLVHMALDAGINFIDTARVYGTSEEILGQALKGRRDEVVLATKVLTQATGGVPLMGDDLRRQMLGSLGQSLSALQTDHVDIWQIHSVDHKLLSEAEVVAEVFDKVRASGQVRFVGGSFYGAELPLQALAYNLFDVMQITYSVLDQRLVDKFFPLATEANIGIVARSVLLKGVLTERAEHLPGHLHELRLRSRSFRELIAAGKSGATPAQVAIAFALAQPAIHAVLIGVSSEQELRSNLHSLSLELTVRNSPYINRCASTIPIYSTLAHGASNSGSKTWG